MGLYYTTLLAGLCESSYTLGVYESLSTRVTVLEPDVAGTFYRDKEDINVRNYSAKEFRSVAKLTYLSEIILVTVATYTDDRSYVKETGSPATWAM